MILRKRFEQILSHTYSIFDMLLFFVSKGSSLNGFSIICGPQLIISKQIY